MPMTCHIDKHADALSRIMRGKGGQLIATGDALTLDERLGRFCCPLCSNRTFTITGATVRFWDGVTGMMEQSASSECVIACDRCKAKVTSAAEPAYRHATLIDTVRDATEKVLDAWGIYQTTGYAVPVREAMDTLNKEIGRDAEPTSDHTHEI